MGFPEVPFQVTVAVDFDGVLHLNKSKWTIPEEIHDGPTPGAVKWVQEMMAEDIKVIVFTTRAKPGDEGNPMFAGDGTEAMKAWLKKYGFPELEVTAEKPSAHLYVDDKAFQFNGENWPSVHTVKSFKPWNRKQWDTNRPKRDLQQRISIAIREIELSPSHDDRGDVLELLDMLKEYGF